MANNETLTQPPRKRGVAAGGSDDDLHAQIQSLFAEQDAKIKTSQQELLPSITMVVDDKYKKMDARTQVVEQRVGEIDSAQGLLEKQVSDLESEDKKMQSQLVLANKNTLSREDVVSTRFDRPPNVEVLKIYAKRFVTKM